MPERRKYEDSIPFQFILDHLAGVDIVIKPMFGCYGIYADGKLCLFLIGREKPLTRPDGEPMQNGVCVATTADHTAQLKREFPNARFDLLKEKRVWVFFSEASDEFEHYVIKACEMMSRRDTRVGR